MLKTGGRVKTLWGNVGTVVTVFNEMAKVVLDHQRNVVNPRFQKQEDLKNAAWYYLEELEDEDDDDVEYRASTDTRMPPRD